MNTILELITVFCFLIFIVYETITMETTVYESPGIWSLKAEKVGRTRKFLKTKNLVSKLSLQPGIYYLGTGRQSDIRIYGCKEKVRLYLDIESENKILLTVLKGEIEIDGKVWKADASVQKIISKNTIIYIEGIRLSLKKEET